MCYVPTSFFDNNTIFSFLCGFQVVLKNVSLNCKSFYKKKVHLAIYPRGFKIFVFSLPYVDMDEGVSLDFG